MKNAIGKSEVVYTTIKIKLPYNHAFKVIYEEYMTYKNLNYNFSSSLERKFVFELNSLNIFISSLFGLP